MEVIRNIYLLNQGILYAAVGNKLKGMVARKIHA